MQGGALKNHAADGLWKCPVARAVQHDLGYGSLATGDLAAGFIIYGLGKAIEFARTFESAGEMERGCRGTVGTTNAGSQQHAAALSIQTPLQPRIQRFELAILIHQFWGGHSIRIEPAGNGDTTGVSGRPGQGKFGKPISSGISEARIAGMLLDGLGHSAQHIGYAKSGSGGYAQGNSDTDPARIRTRREGE